MHKKCLVTKLFHLLHSILDNHEELKLSGDEVGKIRELKIKIKKDLIRDTAEIEVFAVDIISKLWDEKIETA